MIFVLVNIYALLQFLPLTKKTTVNIFRQYMNICFNYFPGMLTDADDIVYDYLNAWTKSNESLTSEYLLNQVNSTRVSIMYRTEPEALCLTTKGLSWQDQQNWTSEQPCPDDAGPLMLLRQTVRNNGIKDKYNVL